MRGPTGLVQKSGTLPANSMPRRNKEIQCRRGIFMPGDSKIWESEPNVGIGGSPPKHSKIRKVFLLIKTLSALPPFLHGRMLHTDVPWLPGSSNSNGQAGNVPAHRTGPGMPPEEPVRQEKEAAT